MEQDESIALQSTEKPPQLRLVNTGTSKLPAGSERVDPTLFQAVQLDDLNLKLDKMISILMSQREQGCQFSIDPITSGTLIELDLHDTPLFSLSVTNDGPGVIEVRLKSRTNQGLTVNATDTGNWSFSWAAIDYVYILPAALTTVRLAGLY
jgi:hypothetical protein